MHSLIIINTPAVYRIPRNCQWAYDKNLKGEILDFCHDYNFAFAPLKLKKREKTEIVLVDLDKIIRI